MQPPPALRVLELFCLGFALLNGVSCGGGSSSSSSGGPDRLQALELQVDFRWTLVVEGHEGSPYRSLVHMLPRVLDQTRWNFALGFRADWNIRTHGRPHLSADAT